MRSFFCWWLAVCLSLSIEMAQEVRGQWSDDERMSLWSLKPVVAPQIGEQTPVSYTHLTLPTICSV